MATQGLVTIREKGRVIVKAVAGCDGDLAVELAEWVKSEKITCPKGVYNKAMEIGFGNTETLAVFGLDGKLVLTDYLPQSTQEQYWKTFEQPELNPRWGHETADYVEVVDL